MQNENVSKMSQDLGDLEAEKLRYEIRHLSLPFWKKPSVLAGVIVPLMGTFLTVGAGWITGFFDQQLTKLEEDKIELGAMNENLSLSHALLESQTSLLESEKESLEKASMELASKNTALEESSMKLASKNTALEEHATSLRSMASNVVDSLEASSGTLDEMFNQKGGLWSEVQNADLPGDVKSRLENQLRGLRANIQSTKSDIEEARQLLESMQQ